MTFKIMVSGPRDCTNREWVYAVLTEAIKDHGDDWEIWEGGANGVDTFARAFSWAHCKKPRTFTANWKLHGKKAGPIRNQEMVDAGPDICIGFLAECSRQRCELPRPHNSHGTGNALVLAATAGIFVEAHKPPQGAIAVDSGLDPEPESP